MDEAEYDQFMIWIDKLMTLFCDSIEDAAYRQNYPRAPLGLR